MKSSNISTITQVFLQKKTWRRKNSFFNYAAQFKSQFNILHQPKIRILPLYVNLEGRWVTKINKNFFTSKSWQRLPKNQSWMTLWKAQFSKTLNLASIGFQFKTFTRTEYLSGVTKKKNVYFHSLLLISAYYNTKEKKIHSSL